MATFRVEYDDDIDNVLGKAEEALKEAGINVSFKCDDLEHDGFDIYEVVVQ